MSETDALEMAKRAGVGAKVFRTALRAKQFAWHNHAARGSSLKEVKSIATWSGF